MYKANYLSYQNIQDITFVLLLKKRFMKTIIHNLDFTFSVFSDSHGNILDSTLKINLSGKTYFLKNDT